MAEPVVSPQTPRKRRRVWRVLAWIVLVFVVLIVAAYFVVTSSPFVKGVILPRVGTALNADITVSDASVHPFSQVVLRDLKVQPRGREPLFTAKEVRARYSLFDILRGNIRVDEVTATTPTVTLIETPAGSNLDPLTKKEHEEKPVTKPSAQKPSKPPQIDVRKVTVNDARFRREKVYADGSRQILELTNVDLALNSLKNGDSGKLTLSAGVSLETNPPPSGVKGVLQGSLKSEYLFALTSELKLLSAKGQSQVTVTHAEGPLTEYSGFAAHFDCDIAPAEVRQVLLRFERAGASLGEIHASGPLDVAKLEGQLKIQLNGVDKRLLDLVGARSGMEFGTTTISSTNELKLANAANAVALAGQFNAARFQVTRAKQTTPTLDLRADYNVSVDRTAGTALLRALTLTGTQNDRPLLNGELTQPMTLAWGNASNAVGDSALNVVLTNLNLADWKPFTGDTAPEGTANARLSLLSQQGGKRLSFDLASQLAGFSARLSDGPSRPADVTLRARGQAVDLKQFAIGEYQLNVLQQNQPALTVSGSGTYDLSNAAANVQVVLHAEVSRLAMILEPDANRPLPNAPVDAKVQLALLNKALDLRQCDLALAPSARATNQLQLRGRVDLSKPDAIDGNLKLTADALDLTDYYDAFAGDQKTKTKSTAGTQPAPPPSPSEKNPPPTQPGQLPFRNFSVDANIGRLYLREVEITNFQTIASVKGSKAKMDPVAFVLNGAPVKAAADVDLGVPGFQYAIVFDADEVPFAPLVNTFEPESKGQLGGTLSAHATINGVGTSGESLQKSLAGNFNIATTNLNLDPSKIQAPMLKLLVSIVATIPQMAQNPETAAGIVSGLTGDFFGRNRSSSAGEITQTPIDVIKFRGIAGQGKVDLQEAVVRSTVFEANARGTVTLASELTNSAIQLPVSIALSRPVAERLGIVPSDTPTNATYVALPDFFTEIGTIGKPKPQLDTKAFAIGALQKLGGKIPGIGGTNAAGLLQGIGSLLPGATANTNVPAGTRTNPPATNQNPVGNVLEQLLGPRRK